MNRKTAFMITLGLVAVVGLIAFIALERSVFKTATKPGAGMRAIYLAGETVQVSVAETPEARAEGLSGRTGLAPNRGMLFVFDSDAQHGFWMKDMLIPIDILWISSEGVVVDMRENVSPATYPTVFTPHTPARYVLELPAGYIKGYNVIIGDRARL